MVLREVVVIFCLSCIYYALVQSECVTPPLECPNENITFWLYTRSNENNPHQVIANDTESIKTAPWVKDAPIKILIHGYTGHKDFAPNTQIRPEYMKCCNYNVISVDYNPICREPCYMEAAKNTELVGKCLAQLIDTLVYNHTFKLENFHIIGFSLGGQTAGYVGDYVTCGRLERITALDPAMPLFVTHDTSKKVDASDAKYVDVMHTNSLEKGKLEQSGHVDIYFNGGMTQPGCKDTKEQTKSGCDHERAPIYYAESINTDVGFYASRCVSWITYMIGWCELTGSEEYLVGEYISREHLMGLKWYCSASEMYTETRVDSFNAIQRKRIASFMSRVDSCKNSIIRSLADRLLQTETYRRWSAALVGGATSSSRGLRAVNFFVKLPNEILLICEDEKQSRALNGAEFYFMCDIIVSTGGFFCIKLYHYIAVKVCYMKVYCTASRLHNIDETSTVSGALFVRTNSEPPYARGPSKKSDENDEENNNEGETQE